MLQEGDDDGDTLFEGLAHLSDQQVQVLLREVDQRNLVIALRGASPALRHKMLGNMSVRVRFFLLDQMSYMRANTATIFEKQVRIVQQYRRLRGMGRL